jgi:hypothetical protein
MAVVGKGVSKYADGTKKAGDEYGNSPLYGGRFIEWQ